MSIRVLHRFSTRTRRRLSNGISVAIGVAILLVMLSPLYWAAVTSLKTNNQAYATPATLLPPTPTVAAYGAVLSTQGSALLSSAIIATGTALFSLLIAAPAAYALAHFRLRVTAIVLLSLLIAQTVPSIVIGTSLFKSYVHIGLLNTYPGLILADSTYSIPFAILVLRAFMLGIPNELLEAAGIDGAGELRRFASVVLPLSLAGLLSVGLFSFLFAWGDFLFALTLTTGDTIRPITLSIYTFIGLYTENWPAVMASALFAAAPAAVLLVLVQRAVRGGLVSTGLTG